jgi:hypothetical protein
LLSWTYNIQINRRLARTKMDSSQKLPQSKWYSAMRAGLKSDYGVYRDLTFRLLAAGYDKREAGSNSVSARSVNQAYGLSPDAQRLEPETRMQLF